MESRQRSQGLAPRALAQELRRKGVGDEETKAALEQIDDDDQRAAARALVDKKLRSLRASTRHSPPAGSPGCSPARATAPAWRSRSSARRWASATTIDVTDVIDLPED